MNFEQVTKSIFQVFEFGSNQSENIYNLTSGAPQQLSAKIRSNRSLNFIMFVDPANSDPDAIVDILLSHSDDGVSYTQVPTESLIINPNQMSPEINASARITGTEEILNIGYIGNKEYLQWEDNFIAGPNMRAGVFLWGQHPPFSPTIDFTDPNSLYV